MRRWGVPALHAWILLAIGVGLAPLHSSYFLSELFALVIGALVFAFAPIPDAWRPNHFFPGKSLGSQPLEQRRRAMRALAIAWLGLSAVSCIGGGSARLEALVLEGGAALLLFGLLRVPWQLGPALRAIAWLGGLHAVVLLAQRSGHDPYLWIDKYPILRGRRMDAYGLLGNPDFCASWLSMCAATTASLALRDRLRGPMPWLLALQLAGIFCARSFASIPALAIAALILALASPLSRADRLRALAIALLALLALCAGLRGRSLASAIEGRLYLDRVGLPHMLDSPVIGLGPGSTQLLEYRWEEDRAKNSSPEQRASEDRFRAFQDHLHCDLLERAIEQGLPALLVFAAILVIALSTALGAAARDPLQAGVAAAIAAFLIRGLVDFPSSRPAELALLVTLLAAPFRATETGAEMVAMPIIHSNANQSPERYIQEPG